MKKIDYLKTLESIEIKMLQLEAGVGLAKIKDAEKDLKVASAQVGKAITNIRSLVANIWKDANGITKKKEKFKRRIPAGTYVITDPKTLISELDSLSDYLEAMSENMDYRVIIDVARIDMKPARSTGLLKKAASSLDVASETLSELIK